MIPNHIEIRRFPDTRSDKGYYAYVRYDDCTKLATVEGKTKQEAYDKAVEFCKEHHIPLPKGE